MNEKQLTRMHIGKGFIAALDQSGGSTPKALASYGILADAYTNDEEMFRLVHEMRTRIITSPAFTSEHILGAILFENTMDRKVADQYTADYLWNQKGIVPFLKIDKGLADLSDGVQVMKPIPGLAELLKAAVAKNVFGTKMRSLIKAADPVGIKKVVAQQYELAQQILAAGLVPIIEPEVDIHSQDKEQSEQILKTELLIHLEKLPKDSKVIFKLSIPTHDDFYQELMKDERVVRVVALSGGYSQAEANEKLAHNHGLIASFSRALSQGLSAQQTETEFDQMLQASIQAIYTASIS